MLRRPCSFHWSFDVLKSMIFPTKILLCHNISYVQNCKITGRLIWCWCCIIVPYLLWICCWQSTVAQPTLFVNFRYYRVWLRLHCFSARSIQWIEDFRGLEDFASAYLSGDISMWTSHHQFTTPSSTMFMRRAKLGSYYSNKVEYIWYCTIRRLAKYLVWKKTWSRWSMCWRIDILH